MAAGRLRSSLRSFLARLPFLWCFSRLLFFSSLRLRLRPLRDPLSLSEPLLLLALRFPPPEDAMKSRRCACAAATSQSQASKAVRSSVSPTPGTTRVRPASASASAAAFCLARCLTTMLSPRVSASPGWPRVKSVGASPIARGKRSARAARSAAAWCDMGAGAAASCDVHVSNLATRRAAGGWRRHPQLWRRPPPLLDAPLHCAAVREACSPWRRGRFGRSADASGRATCCSCARCRAAPAAERASRRRGLRPECAAADRARRVSGALRLRRSVRRPRVRQRCDGSCASRAHPGSQACRSRGCGCADKSRSLRVPGEPEGRVSALARGRRKSV